MDILPLLFVLMNIASIMHTCAMVTNVTADKLDMLNALLNNLWSSSETESRVRRDKYLVKYKKYLMMYLKIMTP